MSTRVAPVSPPEHESDPLLSDLTPEQREAVLHTEGPLLLLAGPGSGKTRVITRRIAHLVRMGIPPWQILAVTFTNKAAGEMRERVGKLLGGDDGEPPRGLTVSTFHALCARLLRRYADLAGVPGLTPTYSIYDSGDQAALMKEVVKNANLSTQNWPARSVLGAVSAAKNALQDAAEFEAAAGSFYARTVAKLYRAYDAALRRANAVDFDDLLLLSVRVMQRSEEAARRIRERFQYIMIDEYQDTNHAQFVLASLIAQPLDRREPNICVVGDPDQSIYGWRGADIGNILEFERRHPGARVIALGRNFRSSGRIVATADALIRHNQRRKHKDLFTSRAAGERPRLTLCQDERHEARVVTEWLREQRLAGGGAAWRDMAVFYRVNALSRVLEEEFRQAGVPYVIARGTAFYDREEVKDALAYLRVVANPSDSVSLRRIINKPTRGVGGATLAHVEMHATRHGLTLIGALRDAASEGTVEGVGARASKALDRFLMLIDEWSSGGTFMGAAAPATLRDLVERVIVESGLEKLYKDRRDKRADPADEDKLENLRELVSSARQFEAEYAPESDLAAEGAPVAQRTGGTPVPPESAPAPAPPMLTLLRAFLESVSLVADADVVDPSQGAVTLMTLHAAKGLEFPAVAIVGLEEGLLPHSRARESDSELEEERRLFFVGVTRAMDRLLVTSARRRTHAGLSERTIRSRFLDELPAEHVETVDLADAWTDDESGPGAGFPRAGARGGARGAGGAAPRAPGERVYVPEGADEGTPAVGSRVRHPQFGEGTVVAIVRGQNARAKIEFRHVGTKTLVLQYARLEVMG